MKSFKIVFILALTLFSSRTFAQGDLGAAQDDVLDNMPEIPGWETDGTDDGECEFNNFEWDFGNEEYPMEEYNNEEQALQAPVGKAISGAGLGLVFTALNAAANTVNNAADVLNDLSGDVNVSILGLINISINLNILGSVKRTARDIIKNAAGVLQVTGATIENAADTVQDLINSADLGDDAIAEVLDILGQSQAALNSAVGTITSTAGAVVNGVGGGVGVPNLNAVVGTLNSVVSTVQSTAATVTSTAEGLGVDLDDVTAAAQGVLNAATSVLGTAGNVLENATSTVNNIATGNVVGAVLNTAVSALGATQNALGNAIDTVTDLIGDLLGGILGLLGGLLGRR